jgi:hypothetical protein
MTMKRVPKESTIRKHIYKYAYKAGFTYHPQTDGTVALFDIHMKYYVFRGTVARAVQTICDNLHMIARRAANA